MDDLKGGVSFDLIKCEFLKFYQVIYEIKDSLYEYINQFKNLFLSKLGYHSIIKNYFNEDHQLYMHSDSILNESLKSFQERKNNLEKNFNLILSYYEKSLYLKLKLDNFDQFFIKEILNVADSELKIKNINEYLQLKELIQNEIQSFFQDRGAAFDLPIINIQLVFNILYDDVGKAITKSSKYLNQINENYNKPFSFISSSQSQLSSSSLFNQNNQQQLENDNIYLNNIVPQYLDSFKLYQEYKNKFNNSNNYDHQHYNSLEIQFKNYEQNITTQILKYEQNQKRKNDSLKLLNQNFMQPNNKSSNGGSLKYSNSNNVNTASIGSSASGYIGFSQFNRSLESINLIENKLKLSNVPVLENLVNDLEFHKYLWSKRFKLVKKFNHSVSFQYDFRLIYKQNSTANNIMVWNSIPLNSQHQNIRKSSMVLLNEDNNVIMDPQIIETTSSESLHQKIWYFNYNQPNLPNARTHFNFHEIVEVDLYKVELVEITDPNELHQAEPISDRDIDFYLRPTDILNFENNIQFEEMLHKTRLYPQLLEDGNIESILSFAYRVYLFIISNFKLRSSNDQSGKPMDTFNCKYGDSKSLSYFFTSIMRYHKIPTRLNFCHLVNINNISTNSSYNNNSSSNSSNINNIHSNRKTPEDLKSLLFSPLSSVTNDNDDGDGDNNDKLVNETDNGQWYIRPDIYIAEIGWIPVDVSKRKENGDSNSIYTQFFGRDLGNMITLSLDFHSEIPVLNHFNNPFVAIQQMKYQYGTNEKDKIESIKSNTLVSHSTQIKIINSPTKHEQLKFEKTLPNALFYQYNKLNFKQFDNFNNIIKNLNNFSFNNNSSNYDSTSNYSGSSRSNSFISSSDNNNNINLNFVSVNNGISDNSEDFHSCPLCIKRFPASEINQHVSTHLDDNNQNQNIQTNLSPTTTTTTTTPVSTFNNSSNIEDYSNKNLVINTDEGDEDYSIIQGRAVQPPLQIPIQQTLKKKKFLSKVGLFKDKNKNSSNDHKDFSTNSEFDEIINLNFNNNNNLVNHYNNNPNRPQNNIETIDTGNELIYNTESRSNQFISYENQSSPSKLFKKSNKLSKSSSLKTKNKEKKLSTDQVRNGPLYEEYLNDHVAHQNLLDNKLFKLKYESKGIIKFNYSKDINLIRGSIEKSIYYLNKPCNLQSQKIIYSTFSVYNEEGEMICESEVIPTDLNPIYKITLNNPPSNYQLRQEIHAELFKVSLVEVSPSEFDQNEINIVEPLSNQENEFYLRQEYYVNNQQQEFQQFILLQKLYPQRFSDGSMESILCFAYRVSLYLKRIEYSPDYSNQEPLQTIRIGKADSCSFSILYQTILRYSGIPCRTLISKNSGLSSRIEIENYRNEFYHHGIGWIPVSTSVYDPSVYNKLVFGQDLGNQITLSINKIKSNELKKDYQLLNPLHIHHYYDKPIFNQSDNLKIN